MPLPAFFLILFFILIQCTAIFFFYFRIYKRKINEALSNASNAGKTLPAPYRVFTILLFSLFSAIILSFFAGMGVSYRVLEKEKDEGQIDIHAYFAVVKEINDNIIKVSGLEINDEKYQSEFTYELYDSLIIEYHDQLITKNDISVGDFVEIILLTSVNVFEDIFKIQLISPDNISAIVR